MDHTPLIAFVIRYQKALIQIDLLRELFMIPDRLISTIKIDDHSFEVPTRADLYVGKLFVFEGQFYAVDTYSRIDLRDTNVKTFKVNATATGIKHDPNEKVALTTPQERFTLQAGEIANYPQGEPLATSLGRFIANYTLLVYPFNDIVPYLNEEITDSKLENHIAMALLEDKVTPRQVKDRYVDAISLIGQSNEIICPNITEKALTIPPHIVALRKKLVADNKQALDAGDASVMSLVEQQLIQAYKDYIKDDPSMHFFLKSKYFNVVIKKLFLTQGMTEKFGEPGKFVFIEQPMGSGWQIENLPDIFNEVRQGSFARAKETANGGVVAKMILRVLQDTRITVDDCKTTKGSHIHGTKDNLKDVTWNYLINPDKTTTLITSDVAKTLVGKDIEIRTPGYCQAELGYCAKCFGRLFEVVGQKAFGPVANGVGRAMLTNSLKSMHGKSHQAINVYSLNNYLV